MMLSPEYRDDLGVIGSSLALAIGLGLCAINGVAVALAVGLVPVVFSIATRRAPGRAGACVTVILAFGSLLVGMGGTRLGVVDALILAAMTATAWGVVSTRSQLAESEVVTPAAGQWMTVEVEFQPAIQSKPAPMAAIHRFRFRRALKTVKVVPRRA